VRNANIGRSLWADDQPAGHRGRRDDLAAHPDEPESRLDPERIARRRAALARITKFGEPVLRNEARRVEVFDDVLRAESQRMGMLMHEALGIGLAAPHVVGLCARRAAGRGR